VDAAHLLLVHEAWGDRHRGAVPQPGPHPRAGGLEPLGTLGMVTVRRAVLVEAFIIQ
jgi:hypothetical protein